MRHFIRSVACAVMALTLWVPSAFASDAATEPATWAFALHGGAGVIERSRMSADTEAAYRDALRGATDAAIAVLEDGGSSLDAVETALRLLEDDPKFNAGRGAVFTADGSNELDASIMWGRDRSAGAVAGVSRLRHPISAARLVMERSRHVMLSGAGAEDFAFQHGVAPVDPAYFYTARRFEALQRVLDAQAQDATQDADTDKRGTVGAVALDMNGDLAAGTSTGGMTAKRYGRIGDSPIIGAGTYADNASCAVSATGHGEYFIRVGVARMICARVALGGMALQEAADATLAEVADLGGDGGVVALGPDGAPIWSFNTPGMYRARAVRGGPVEVAVFGDE